MIFLFWQVCTANRFSNKIIIRFFKNCSVLEYILHYLFVLDHTTKNANPLIISVRISHSMHEIFFLSLTFKHRETKVLTDARAFPISSPELPAVVPRLAAQTKRIISPITYVVNRTGTLCLSQASYPWCRLRWWWACDCMWWGLSGIHSLRCHEEDNSVGTEVGQSYKLYLIKNTFDRWLDAECPKKCFWNKGGTVFPTHHPILGVNSRERASLPDVWRVSQHGGVARRRPGVFWGIWRYMQNLKTYIPKRNNTNSLAIIIHTLHIKRPWINSSWFCTGVASIVSGIVVTGRGGIYLGKYVQLTRVFYDCLVEDL